MPLRRGEEKEVRTGKEREKGSAGQNKKEEEISRDREKDRKEKWEVKHCPISKHHTNM